MPNLPQQLRIVRRASRPRPEGHSSLLWPNLRNQPHSSGSADVKVFHGVLAGGAQDFQRQQSGLGQMLEQPYTNGAAGYLQQPVQSQGSTDFSNYAQAPSRSGTASPGPMRQVSSVPGGLERAGSSSSSARFAAALPSSTSSTGKPISKQGAKVIWPETCTYTVCIDYGGKQADPAGPLSVGLCW